MVSLIIPTWNEARILGETLDHLSRLRGVFEIIVSDGGSSDTTRALVRKRPAVRWVSGSPGRARQLDRGVGNSSGELLLFVHADTLLPDDAILALNRLEELGKPVAGGFPHRYSRGGPLIRLASLVHSARSWLTGVYYGDQAPFVSRVLYERVGGFGDLPVMEDLDFALRVRRHVRPVRMANPICNSPRRLEARGVMRSALDALYVLTRYRLGNLQGLDGHRFFTPVR